MSYHHNGSDILSLTLEDRQALEIRWQEGTLDRRLAELIEFVKHHKESFLEIYGSNTEPHHLIDKIKQYVVESGTVDHASEMMDQAREIRDEIWIRGEKGDHDLVNILQEWTSLHALSWRRWRLKQYIFVAERCAPELLKEIAS